MINTIDLLPGATAEVYKKVIEIILNDENVDAIISIFVEPIMVSAIGVIEEINSIRSNKPILQTAMPLPEFWNIYRQDSLSKFPVYRNPEDPPEVLCNMLFYNEKQNSLNKNRAEYKAVLNITSSSKSKLPAGFIPQNEINDLCIKYSIPIIQSKLLKHSEIFRFDCDFYPIVLKGINSKVIHKSELNAVKLNLKNKNELIAASEEIKSNFLKLNYEVEEFLIQQYVEAKHELLIGGFNDPSFGPVIIFGSGGKYVEIYDDVAIKSCYLCDEDLEDMIDMTKIGKILRGVRGEKSCNIPELKKIITTCAKMMLENDSISEFDINPLVVDKNNNFFAVDVRIKQ